MKVFVSHAGEDSDALSELLRELERQELSYFDYAKPYSENKIGQPLEIRMQEEISTSDLVVVFITKTSASPNKPIVIAEVEEAIDQGFLDRNRLIGVQIRDKDKAPDSWMSIPIETLRRKLARQPVENPGLSSLIGEHKNYTAISTALWKDGAPTLKMITPWVYDNSLFFSPKDYQLLKDHEDPFLFDLLNFETQKTWFGVFSKLSSHAWAHIDKIEPGCFFYLSKIICRRLGQTFIPPAPLDQRLPILDKLYKEIYQHPQYVRQLIMCHIDAFQDYLAMGQWQEALISAKCLVATLEENHIQSYYSNILIALCCMHLKDFDTAHKVFKECLEHEDSDENASGGISKAMFQKAHQERDSNARIDLYRGALLWCNQAVELIASRHDPQDKGATAQMDRMSMALQIQNHASETGLELDEDFKRLLNNGILDHDVLDTLRPPNNQFEDILKWKEIVAMKHLHNNELELADKTFSELLEKPLGTIYLSTETVSKIPYKLDNTFLAEIADVGIFLDDLDNHSLKKLARGNEKEFIIRETENCFKFTKNEAISRFTESKYIPYELCIINSSIVHRWFEIRKQLEGSLSPALMKEYSKRVALTGNTDLFRHVIVSWCNELDNFEEAAKFLDANASSIKHENPQLLVDRAGIALHSRNSQYAHTQFIEAQNLIISQLMSDNISDKCSVIELITLWSQTSNQLGDEQLSTACEIISERLSRIDS